MDELNVGGRMVSNTCLGMASARSILWGLFLYVCVWFGFFFVFVCFFFLPPALVLEGIRYSDRHKGKKKPKGG